MKIPMLQTAVELAQQAHVGQWRDGDAPLPYIAHPLDVMHKLRYIGEVTDPEVLAAAVLHDVLEETDLTAKAIEKALGARVTDLVRQVTRREPTEAETRGLTKEQIWQLRTDWLMAEIESEMSPEAWQIKLADRLSNLQAAKVTRTAEKLKRYLAQSERMLTVIPEVTNPPLWHAIVREMESIRAERIHLETD